MQSFYSMKGCEMPSLKKSIPYSIMALVLLSGCTQIVTAPISIVGSVASTTIEVAGSTVGAVAGTDDEDEN